MKFSFTKNPESAFFYKESKSNKKKNSGGCEGARLGGGGLARVRFFFCSKESKS